MHRQTVRAWIDRAIHNSPRWIAECERDFIRMLGQEALIRLKGLREDQWEDWNATSTPN